MGAQQQARIKLSLPCLVSTSTHPPTSRPEPPRKAESSYLTFSVMPCSGPCCCRASASASSYAAYSGRGGGRRPQQSGVRE
jgi:hypothetical protein